MSSVKRNDEDDTVVLKLLCGYCCTDTVALILLYCALPSIHFTHNICNEEKRNINDKILNKSFNSQSIFKPSTRNYMYISLCLPLSYKYILHTRHSHCPLLNAPMITRHVYILHYFKYTIHDINYTMVPPPYKATLLYALTSISSTTSYPVPIPLMWLHPVMRPTMP